MRPTGSKEIRCPACRYRAAPTAGYLCEYAGITGHTRGAVPPEKCKHFEPGKAIAPMNRAGWNGEAKPTVQDRTARKRGHPRYDWEKGRELYDRGYNDDRIAEELGCSPRTVEEWRRRHHLPAWSVKRRKTIRR